MIIVVCLDEKKGMLFNHRRQSSDKVVTERLQKMCAGKKLWMNRYSGKMYGNLEGTCVVVEDDFLSQAGSGEFCLVESESLAPFAGKIEKLIVYWWNRTYPADLYLDLDLSQWKSTEKQELEGNSHEKIIEEIYERR